MRIIIGVAVLAALVAIALTVPDEDRSAKAGLLCPEERAPQLDAASLDGSQLADARATAKAYHCEVRVVERDGKDLPVTADLRQSRINVAIADGQVIDVRGIG